MYAGPRSHARRMNKRYQERMLIRYLTVLEISEVVKFQDDIRKKKSSWKYIRNESSFSRKRDQSKPNNGTCARCGYNHPGNLCPAKTKQRNHCKRIGQFEKQCRKKVKKEGGHIHRVLVEQVWLNKAPTVRVTQLFIWTYFIIQRSIGRKGQVCNISEDYNERSILHLKVLKV